MTHTRSARLGLTAALVPEFLGPWIGRSPETAKELRSTLPSGFWGDPPNRPETRQRFALPFRGPPPVIVRSAEPETPIPSRRHDRPDRRLAPRKSPPGDREALDEMVERKLAAVVVRQPDLWMTTLEAATTFGSAPSPARPRTPRDDPCPPRRAPAPLPPRRLDAHLARRRPERSLPCRPTTDQMAPHGCHAGAWHQEVDP